MPPTKYTDGEAFAVVVFFLLLCALMLTGCGTEPTGHRPMTCRSAYVTFPILNAQGDTVTNGRALERVCVFTDGR